MNSCMIYFVNLYRLVKLSVVFTTPLKTPSVVVPGTELDQNFMLEAKRANSLNA